MSMCHYPAGADCVSREFVKSICLVEYAKFIQVMSEVDVSFDDVCYGMAAHSQLPDAIEGTEEGDKLGEALDAMVKKFNEVTKLELCFAHAEREERSDELDGGSFAVEGVWVVSEAGKKYKEHIENKTWCTFG